MNYIEIEDYLNAGDLEGMLAKLTPIFIEVRALGDTFLDSKVYNSGHEVKNTISQLNGYASTLKVASIVIDTFKTRKETVEFNRIKTATETAGGKFTATSGEKEASAFVDSERRVRNLVDAYLHVCKDSIITGQSIMNYLTEEMKFNKGA